MSGASTETDHGEGIQASIEETPDTDDESLPDVFGTGLKDIEKISLPLPVGGGEQSKMIGITDTAPASSRSRRKPKVTRKRTQKESSSEVNESLSDIFDGPVTFEISSEEPSDTPRRLIKETNVILPPSPPGEEDDGLDPTLADDDSLNTVTKKTGGKESITGVEELELITEETDNLHEDVGIRGSNVPRRKVTTGPRTGTRGRTDASSDEGVVISSENEVSPLGSRGPGMSSGKERRKSSGVKEIAETEAAPVVDDLENQPTVEVSCLAGGKAGGCRRDEAEVVPPREKRDCSAKGNGSDEVEIVSPTRRLRNPKLVDSQSDSEEGSLVDDVERCKEESRKNRLKIVVSLDALKKYSPVKGGDSSVSYVNLGADAGGTEDGDEEKRPTESDQDEQKAPKIDDEEPKATKAQQVEEDDTAGDAVKTKSKKADKEFLCNSDKGVSSSNDLKLTIKKVQDQKELDSGSASDTKKTRTKADKTATTTGSSSGSDDSTRNDFLQDFRGIRCTSCNEQLNQFNRKSLCKHPTLGVLICRRCIEYYYEGEFSKDEHGSDEQCQWCGEGGNLICCDKCPSAFCKSCICRNLSRKEWTRISLNEDADWHCYVCYKEPVRELIRNCKSVIKWAEKNKGREPLRDTDKRDRPSRPPSQPRDRSAEQLRSFLEGKGKHWDLFQAKLEDVKKWSNQKDKKQLVQAVMNLRKFRKYIKAYQSHFEHCLEEVMSSGELTGGEGATDSLTAQEESKENSQEAEEKVVEAEDGEESPTQELERTSQDLNETQEESSKKEQPPLTKNDQQPKSKEQRKEEKEDGSDGEKDAGDMEDGNDVGKKSSSSTKLKVRESSLPRVKVTPKSPSKGANNGKEICLIELDGDEDEDESRMSVDCPDDKGTEGSYKKNRDSESSGNEGGRKGNNSDEEGSRVTEIGPAIGVTIWGDEGEEDLAGGVKEKNKEEKLKKPAITLPEEKSEDSEKSKKCDDVSEESKQKDSTTSDKRKTDDRDPGSRDTVDEEIGKDSLKELDTDHDGDVEDSVPKREGKEKKRRKQKPSKGKSEKASSNSKEETGKVEDENSDDFEKLLMDEMDSDAEEDKRGTEPDPESDSEGSSEEIKKKKKKSPGARKSLSLGKGTRRSLPKYVDDGSTSDTEVSLIDVDLADALDRKGKKKRKRRKESLDSDTDAEIERIAKRPRKRKKRASTKEEEGESSGNDEAPTKSKKSKKTERGKKDEKGSDSASDIDDEIDRLDIADLNSGSTSEGAEVGKRKAKKNSDADTKEKAARGSKRGKKGKKAKEKVESELSSSEDDEELPVINYDTDPEMLMKCGKSNEKKSQKVENAEEDLAEKRLLEELEDGSSKEPLDSSSDEQSEGREGGKKSKGKGGGRGSKKQKGKSEKKEESSNNSSGEENNGSQRSGQSRSKKKAKVHRLLKSKLISSSSSSNSDEEWNPRKKKVNDLIDREEKSEESKKRGRKKGGKGGRRGKVSDSDFTDEGNSSSDSSVGNAKKKTGKSRKRNGRDSSDASGSEDEIVRKIQKKKKGRATQSSDSDEGSGDDFAAERKKPRSYQVKAKKKSRIKKMASSESEPDGVKRGAAKSGGSETDDEFESPSKGKARKKIRKVMSKKKLTQETRTAAEEERERRKRVLKRRQELIASEMDSPQKSSALKEVVLDKDLKTKEVLLEIDPDLVKVLKPHQAKGIQFMFDCTFETVADADKPGSGCILAHCMGLGKTLQVIAFLHAVMTNKKTNVKTALVVAPLNTVLNWQAEFEKWQQDLDEVVEVNELASYKDNQVRAEVLRMWQREGGVMIMGYTMYRNLVFSRFVKRKKQKETFHQTLVEPGPDIVICDEGHLLKNDATATAKAMNSIRTRRRICLTGTPLQNNLIEYHCMVQFVKPKLLGTRKEFSNRFVNPINNGQCADSSPFDVKLMKKRAHILHNLLSGSVQRKDYSALAPYLPPKHEYVILIRLSAKQIELYEEYLKTQTGSDQGSEGRTSSLFKDYQSLMNVWTHPRLLKLAAIRTEKRREIEQIREFVDDSTDVDTSDEDALRENERDSSSGDELMKNILASQEIKKEETNGEIKEVKQKKKKKEKKEGSSGSDETSSEDNSDSSIEVIKTWNTRRTRGNGGLEEEEFEAPPPKKEWFTDMVQDCEDLKIELSGKLVILFEILKLAAAVGEKVLLFSQSLLTLDLIEDILEDQALKNVVDNAEKRRITLSTNQEIEIEMESYDTWTKGMDYFRIDGSTDASIRKGMCDKFNEVDNVRARLFLVSTRAGSLGINLVAASRVIIFDACWNPSHDIQSIFRVYRFGQEKAVYIYRFIAQGTMEERIYDRQVTKQSLAQRVVDEQQVKRHFTQTELSELYNFEPDRLDDPNREERPTPILPKDFVLAELLHCQNDWIVKYHEHDSLLENVIDEGLTEEERKAAWKEYEAEKEGRIQEMAGLPPGFPPGFNPGAQVPTPAMYQTGLTVAQQLQQMAQGRQGAGYDPMNQPSALQRMLMSNHHPQNQQRNPISLGSLFAMSQQMGQAMPQQMGQGQARMAQPQLRMPQPHPGIRQSLFPGVASRNPQTSQPPSTQSQAAYNSLTSRLIQQALTQSAVVQGNAMGQTPSRVITVPPNLPSTMRVGQPPPQQPPNKDAGE